MRPTTVGATTVEARSQRAAHLPALDGLRGIAILLVMQYHFWGWPFITAGPQPNTIDRWLNRVVHVGWSGVDLFFVLSGFLITGILLDAKASGRGVLRNFWIRRLLRLAPVYYVFLVFVLFVAPHIPQLRDTVDAPGLRDDQWWFWTYTYNIGSSFKAFEFDPPLVHGHFWSLAVEEQFYLVWPFVVWMLSRRQLAICCVVLVAVAFGFRIAVIEGAWPSVFNLAAVYHLTPARMDTLALGALIAVAIREGWLLDARPWALAALAGAAAVLATLFIQQDGLQFFQKDTIRIGYLALALLYAATLVAVLTEAPASRVVAGLSNGVLRAFGRYSYCLYVIHPLVLFQLSDFVNEHDLVRTLADSRIPYNILFSLTATGIAFAIAWTSWRLIEQPILRLKSRFEYVAAPTAETAETTLTSPLAR